MTRVGISQGSEHGVSITTRRMLLFCALCLLGAELGHSLSFQNQSFATFWPPAGILLAALLSTRLRDWPILLSSAMAASIFSDVLLHQRSLGMSLGLSATYLAEGFIGAILLRRFVSDPFQCSSRREVFGLGLYAAVLSSAVGAVIGASFLAAAGSEFPFSRNCSLWWGSHSLGILLVTPLLLVKGDPIVPQQGRRLILPRLELILAFLGLIATTWLVFGAESPPSAPIFRFPSIITFPFLLWIGIRFAPRTVAAAMFVLATVAIWQTARGGGPFSWVTIGEQQKAGLLQIFMNMMYLTSMLLSAALGEYRKTERELLASREEALRTSVFLQAILDSANHTIISSDEKGTIRSFNKAAERFLGYNADDLVGKATPAMFHDPDEVIARARQLSEELGYPVEPGFEAFVARARRGEVDEREWTYVPKDGQRYPVKLSVTALRETDAEITGFLGISGDISDRKTMEEALEASRCELEQKVLERTFAWENANQRLQESRERFRQLADSMPQMVWAATPGGKLDYYNQRWYDFTGVERESDKDQGWIPLLHPDDVDRAVSHWNGCVKSGEPSECEYRLFDRASGGYLWHLGRARPVRNERGEIVRWFGTFTEIDTRKRIEEALRESEARQARAMTAARLGHWEWDVVNDRITHLGGKKILYGIEEHEHFANFEEFSNAVHPDDRALLKRSVKKCVATGGPYDVEFRIVWPDGSIHWIASKGGLFCNAAGEPVRMAGVNIDVTDRKLAELEILKLNEDLEKRVEERTAELARAKEIAENAAKAKGDFLANMSHEIRTPMNGVIGMTELLLDTELNDLQRDYAGTIHSSGEALLTVINDILDLSKIEAGKMTIALASFDLRSLMEEVADLLAPSAHRKRLQITGRVEPKIARRVIGDPVRVRQILTNLVSNAVKFTDSGEVRINAEFAQRDKSESTIRISVVDSGCGIAQELHGEVFESFTQVESRNNRRHGGTGLGLTICRHLVGMLGGVIALESEPGVGSTFWFELEMPASGDLPEEPAPIGLTGLRAMIVDDNATNRQIVREALNSWSIDVVEAASGLEAIEKLRDSPDLPLNFILIDQQMPGMNGMETAASIRRIPGRETTPFVLLSSSGGTLLSESARTRYFQGTLTKPIRRLQLQQALAKLAGESTPVWTNQGAEAKSRKHEKIQILLAEDNEVNRRVALGMLSKLGCHVDIAEDGVEVVRRSGVKNYDLILMDIQMPKMDGLVATGEIRRREKETGKHVTIVAMTAHAMLGDAERCLAAGMDDYATKPLRSAILETILNRWINSESSSSTAPEPSDDSGERRLPDADSDWDFQPFFDACYGDTEMVREILGLAIENVRDRLQRIKVAIDARDGAAIEFEAHALKGVFLTIGLATEVKICQDMMERGRECDFEPLPRDFENFATRWKGLRRAIRQQIETLSPLKTVP